MLPVMVTVELALLSPLFKNPPFKIRPGLPPTPGKLAASGGTPLNRSSVLVFKVNESPGKATVPVMVGDRTRVLFRPLPMLVPLKTRAYALPVAGATAVPVPFVRQMAAVQSAPVSWTLVVVSATPATGVALT